MENENQNDIGKSVSSPRPALVGRELDMTVAERVMGWQHRQTATYCEPPFVSCPVCTTRFSTDIAAAMQVVENLRGRGLDVAFMLEATGLNLVEVFRSTDYARISNESEPFAISLPEAICRAALAALSVPERETETLQGEVESSVPPEPESSGSTYGGFRYEQKVRLVRE